MKNALGEYIDGRRVGKFGDYRDNRSYSSEVRRCPWCCGNVFGPKVNYDYHLEFCIFLPPDEGERGELGDAITHAIDDAVEEVMDEAMEEAIKEAVSNDEDGPH